jgi:hypothetical protein
MSSVEAAGATSREGGIHVAATVTPKDKGEKLCVFVSLLSTSDLQRYGKIDSLRVVTDANRALTIVAVLQMYGGVRNGT